MRSAIYVETSILSYLAARPSRDLIVAARQQLTHAWWRERRPRFDLYVSQVVVDEVRAGHPEAAERRVAFLAVLPMLDVTPKVADLAVASARRCGCRAHRRGSLPRDGLSPDLELCPYRER